MKNILNLKGDVVSHVAVIGLGLSGLSCVKFLLLEGAKVTVFDTRSHPPGTDKLPAQVELVCGPLLGPTLSVFKLIIASPGVALSTPALKDAARSGSEIVGDIELFARKLKTPEFQHAKCVAITASNGKSTVTTLLGEMAVASQVNAVIGGNIGIPALDLLSPQIELYILELSSFQLETTRSLSLDISTILNISEDHLDRYNSYQDYIDTKHIIYQQSQKILINTDDQLTHPKNCHVDTIKFGFSNSDYDLIKTNGKLLLAKNNQPLLATSKIKLSGKHNWLNALAAFALGDAVELDHDAMLQAIVDFKGLAHRCEFVAEINGVRWVNDSKATNVGATQAALVGLEETITGKVHVILGGEGKGADFSALKPALEQISGRIICIGTDGAEIARNSARAELCDDLKTAITKISDIAQQGDLAILSPACASFDMFDNFMARGDAFKKLVAELATVKGD
ncbi:MAG TPA: UDP-N-acetylmuramoyl-L-alanine--D-glutamate ligase [Psychromonas hadalis]|nr:UDP-N-acetylmuramoyl-L-alanine--D-glutamate ligase [Psychromonas hadalis]